MYETESPVLVGQRNMSWEKERADTDFAFLVLTCLFGGFVFTGSHLVKKPFSEPIPKWGPQLSTIFTLSWLVFTHIFTYLSLAVNFQTWSVSYFCLVSEREHIRFQWCYTCIEDLGLLFFLVISNYCSHSPITGWPKMSALVWVTQRSAGCSCRLYVRFFFILVFSSLSSSQEISLSFSL